MRTHFSHTNTHGHTRSLERGMHLHRICCVLTLIIGLNAASISLTAERTLAYYADSEHSSGNTLATAMLDIRLNSTSTQGYVGVEADGDIDDISTVLQEHADSLSTRYRITTSFEGGTNAFCRSLQLQIDHQGTPWQFFGNQDPLTLSRATTSTLGTFEFNRIGAGRDARSFAHGTSCQMDLVFESWRRDSDTPATSGYTDTERFSLDIQNRMIVMNEFLPNPDPSAGGVNFKTDHARKPHGEWIELYNNSNQPYTLNDWQFRDEAGNTVDITAANTDSGTTTIQAGDWLVVYMNKAVLNNTGDTIMLENGAGDTIDKTSYKADSNACEQTPTPSATNTDSTSGSCDEVSPNKSWARFPDGIGAWVDPAPTPGHSNINSSDMQYAIAPATPQGPTVAGISTSTPVQPDTAASSTDQQKASTTPNTASSTSPTPDAPDAHTPDISASGTNPNATSSTTTPAHPDDTRSAGHNTSSTTASTTDPTDTNSATGVVPRTGSSTPPTDGQTASSTPDTATTGSPHTPPPMSNGGTGTRTEPTPESESKTRNKSNGSSTQPDATRSAPENEPPDKDTGTQNDRQPDTSDTGSDDTSPSETDTEPTDTNDSTDTDEDNTSDSNTNSEHSTTEPTPDEKDGTDAPDEHDQTDTETSDGTDTSSESTSEETTAYTDDADQSSSNTSQS